MLSIIFHLLLMIGMLWYQRQQKYAPSLPKLLAVWYAVSVMLIFIESSLVTGETLSGLFLQGLLVGLFYLPAVYFTFRWARRHRDGLWKAFGLFLAFSLISTVAAGIFLARAENVFGWSILER